MHEAIAAKAAPMRIPFSTIPEAGLEEDVGKTRKAPMAPRPVDPAYALWLENERRFKVLAEQTHRDAQSRVRRPFQPSGAGGRTARVPASDASNAPPSLF